MSVDDRAERVDIAFRTRRLERIFNSERRLRSECGDRLASALIIRLAVLRTAETLSMIPSTPPERLHQFSGRRAGQYAVDLAHPFRLVFAPNHDPVPLRNDGGIDTARVSAITIVEVVDYH